MKVLVVTQIAENERDLEIIMVGCIKGLPSMVSPIVTIEGAADVRNGNPYIVYGKEVAEFTGLNKLACDITVADCRSGSLPVWEADSGDYETYQDCEAAGLHLAECDVDGYCNNCGEQ